MAVRKKKSGAGIKEVNWSEYKEKVFIALCDRIYRRSGMVHRRFDRAGLDTGSFRRAGNSTGGRRHTQLGRVLEKQRKVSFFQNKMEELKE
jgi:hypothetical protein